MSVCSKISADILRDCDNLPTGGLKQRVVLINSEDLPKSGISFDATFKNELITGLTLSTGTQGFMVEGVKSDITGTVATVVNDTGFNGGTHTLSGLKILSPSEEAIKEINKLMGANVYAVVETNWGGTDDKYSFRFFGARFGLELTADSVQNFKENDGAFVFNLSTPNGYKEPYQPPIVRITDYATTNTAFGNKFKA